MMVERIPSEEKEGNAEITLEKTVFSQLDGVVEHLGSQAAREYGDLLRILKEGTFQYTSYFLDNLLSQEKLKGVTGRDELRESQEEVMQTDAVRHYSDETLPVNFRVVGRFLSRHHIPVAWFNQNYDDLTGMKERNMLKIFSVRYALGSAMRYEELSRRGKKTKEETLELGKIISSVETTEDIKELLEKFRDLPSLQQRELLEGLNS